MNKPLNKPLLAVKCLGLILVLIGGLFLVLGPVYFKRDNQNRTLDPNYPRADTGAHDSGMRFYGGMFGGLAALAIGSYLLNLKPMQKHD